MKPTYVLATADSRLNADIMMIRLRRAGINLDRVSAVFSRQFAPNSFFFWLRSPRTLRCPDNGESYFVAGPLQQLLAGENEVEALPGMLQRLGLQHSDAAQFARSLWLGRGVLCAQAKNQDEVAIIWHIFKHSRSDEIAVSDSGAPKKSGGHAEVPVPSAWLPAFAV